MEEAKQKLSHHLGLDFSETFTIQDIVTISSAILTHPDCTVNDLAVALGYHRTKLSKFLSVIKKRLSALRGEAKEQFKKETFTTLFPKQADEKSDNVPSTSSEAFQTVELQAQCDAKDSIIQKLAKQLKKERKKSKALGQQANIYLRQKKVLKKRNLRLQASLVKKKETVKRSRKEGKELQKETTSLQQNISKLTKKLESTEKAKRFLVQERESLLQKFEDEAEKREEADTESARREGDLKKEMREKLQDSIESISYLENLLSDSRSDEITTTEEDGKSFNTDTTFCIMQLLSEGVGVHHVTSVMKSVADLCRKKFTSLPSVRTINRIGDQRLSVAYKQIEECLSGKKSTTLQSDETRKHGDTYEVFSVRDSTSTEWVLGLKEMSDKSASTCLDTFRTILSDIEDCTTTETGKKVLFNIKNTMSDRAATEKKFHTLLETYREEILPQVYSNWDELSTLEQDALTRVNNFYCGLHILVNMAEVADKVVAKYETTKERKVGAEANTETASMCKEHESGAVRLVRTACKCFARGADEKSGCYRDFRTFLQDKGEVDESEAKKSQLIVPFRGNRFNILFYNAEAIFFLADDIKEYFKKVSSPANRLQKSVLYDVEEQLYLAILKALALCSKLVTSPFWRYLEKRDCSIQEASFVYQRLSEFLMEAKEDCTDVLSGDFVPFPELVKRDEIYTRLMQADPFDADVCAVLQLIFQAWQSLLLTAASDHLPGGCFSEMDEETQQETASVPTHNKFPERVFALLDALTRFRPVATTLCNESYIMFSLNKTGDWLASLSADKKRDLLDSSKKEGRQLRSKYLQRIKEITQQRKDSLKRRRAEKERKEQEKAAQKQNIVNDMLYYGLYQYPETVDVMLKTIRTSSEKRKALRTQLLFRKLILEQQADRSLFLMSSQGRPFTIEQLTENVKALIDLSLKAPAAPAAPLAVQHFTGKRIIHYQMSDNIRTPFPGRVVSSVPGYPQWYNVVYDGDEAVYVYKLSEDFTSGDLEIVAEGS